MKIKGKHLHYIDNGKVVILNLEQVCKFRQSADTKPRVEISFSNNPNSFETIPYSWEDFASIIETISESKLNK